MSSSPTVGTFKGESGQAGGVRHYVGRAGELEKALPIHIGNDTTISGNLSFAGELAVMGTVHGNILAEDSSSSVVKLSESARVEGEIRVPMCLSTV